MELYDDFSGDELNPEKWRIAQMTTPEGEVIWTWQDENLTTTVGDGRVRLSIPQFSLQHDTVPMFDNPKALYASMKMWQLDGPVSFKTTIAADITGDKDDYRDGFASFNVLDFATGTVLDIVANGGRLWGIYELLDIPGIDKPREPFAEFIDLGVETGPMQEHEGEVRYHPGNKIAQWVIDGEVRAQKLVEMDPQQFFLAFGIITFHPITDGRSTSLRGQGGRAQFGPVYIEGAAE